MRRICVVLAALTLAGCSTTSGVPTKSFVNKNIEGAYIPLDKKMFVFFEGDAAGVSLGRGVAVTTAHNANLLDAKSIIGKSPQFDLLFFHTLKPSARLAVAPPRMGETVIAYGQGKDGALRQATGKINVLEAPVKPECAKCRVQTAFTFVGDAGPGFSGGPVLDAKDGHLIGIIFGYVETKGGRTIYAYPMDTVTAELDALQGRLPIDVD